MLLEWDGSSSNWSIVATSLDWHIYGLAVFNGKLYGGSYRDTSHLFEWNGVDAWIERGSLPNYEALESLVVFNESVYAGTNNGNLYRWDGVDLWFLLLTSLLSCFVCLSLLIDNSLKGWRFRGGCWLVGLLKETRTLSIFLFSV